MDTKFPGKIYLTTIVALCLQPLQIYIRETKLPLDARAVCSTWHVHRVCCIFLMFTLLGDANFVPSCRLSAFMTTLFVSAAYAWPSRTTCNRCAGHASFYWRTHARLSMKHDFVKDNDSTRCTTVVSRCCPLWRWKWNSKFPRMILKYHVVTLPVWIMAACISPVAIGHCRQQANKCHTSCCPPGAWIGSFLLFLLAALSWTCRVVDSLWHYYSSWIQMSFFPSSNGRWDR